MVRDGDRFEGPSDLRAQRADPLAVVRVQARQLIELIVDRWRFPHDPPEGVRRYAEARRYADAFDSRKLPQLRALAADGRDLRLVDLLKTHHVAVRPEGVDPPRIASGATAACSSVPIVLLPTSLAASDYGDTPGLETTPPGSDNLMVAGAFGPAGPVVAGPH